MEFQACTGRKVGWGREGGSAAPGQGQLRSQKLLESRSHPQLLSRSRSYKYQCPAGVLGEQHASRLCSRHEPAQPTTLLPLAEKCPIAIPNLALPSITWPCPAAQAPEVSGLCVGLPERSSSDLGSVFCPKEVKQHLPPPAALTQHHQEPVASPKTSIFTFRHASCTLREHQAAWQIPCWNLGNQVLRISAQYLNQFGQFLTVDVSGRIYVVNENIQFLKQFLLTISILFTSTCILEGGSLFKHLLKRISSRGLVLCQWALILKHFTGKKHH